MRGERPRWIWRATHHGSALHLVPVPLKDKDAALCGLRPKWKPEVFSAPEPERRCVYCEEDRVKTLAREVV